MNHPHLLSADSVILKHMSLLKRVNGFTPPNFNGKQKLEMRIKKKNPPKRKLKRKEGKVSKKGNKYLEASLRHFEAKKLEAEAVLDTYFNNAVGIGEHSDLPSEVNKWVEKLATAEDAYESLIRYKDRN